MANQEVQTVQSKSLALQDELSVTDVLNQIQKIQDIMSMAMHDNEHYGTIPGTNKPTLYKAGAEKLGLLFRFAPEFEIERNDNYKNAHREFIIVCTLRHIPTQTIVGQGTGSCSTMEGKYRFRNSDRVCPECGLSGTIIKGKEEYGGGWLCFAKKGGCGAKWEDGSSVIESQQPGKEEHDNPADYYNTCLKMAKKRAHVDAMLTATAASDIFTQDLEDMKEVIPNITNQKKPAKPPTQTPKATTDEDIIDIVMGLEQYKETKDIKAGLMKKIDEYLDTEKRDIKAGMALLETCKHLPDIIRA
jgi:hypothetical protein